MSNNTVGRVPRQPLPPSKRDTIFGNGKRRINFSLPDSDDVFQFIVFSAFVGFIVFVIAACFNHGYSVVKEQVQAMATNRQYKAAWTETEIHWNHDSKGRVTNSYTTNTHHPEEWHVNWSYNSLTYDQSTGYNYDGIKLGDHRQMVIREGGVFHNVYLWPN